MASVHFEGRSVPLYFSMRNYPKRKNQFDQKKMKSSFMKALRHILAKKYTYTIVADRGFGNAIFAQLCEDNGFDFMLRIKEDWRIKVGDQIKKSGKIPQNAIMLANSGCPSPDENETIE